MSTVTTLGLSTPILLAAMAFGNPVAQEPKGGGPAGPDVRRGANHLVFPVRTPLQRLLVRGKDAKILVVVNGTGCYDEGEIDSAAIGALRRDLGRSARAGDAVQFRIFFEGNSRGLDTGPLERALAGLAGDLGLRSPPAGFEWTNEPVTWKQKLTQIDEGRPPGARGEEAGIGDGETVVYPVRTELSRYLTGADVYVDLKGSLAGDPEKGKAAVATIRSSVTKLGVPRKKRICFHFYAAPEMSDAEHRGFFRDLEAFSKSLGFENFVLTVGG
jgi:hypothetical protein